jgi:hypothetical protein
MCFCGVQSERKPYCNLQINIERVQIMNCPTKVSYPAVYIYNYTIKGNLNWATQQSHTNTRFKPLIAGLSLGVLCGVMPSIAVIRTSKCRFLQASDFLFKRSQLRWLFKIASNTTQTTHVTSHYLWARCQTLNRRFSGISQEREQRKHARRRCMVDTRTLVQKHIMGASWVWATVAVETPDISRAHGSGCILEVKPRLMLLAFTLTKRSMLGECLQ